MEDWGRPWKEKAPTVVREATTASRIDDSLIGRQEAATCVVRYGYTEMSGPSRLELGVALPLSLPWEGAQHTKENDMVKPRQGTCSSALELPQQPPDPDPERRKTSLGGPASFSDPSITTECSHYTRKDTRLRLAAHFSCLRVRGEARPSTLTLLSSYVSNTRVQATFR